jgi:hypothetical protein
MHVADAQKGKHLIETSASDSRIEYTGRVHIDNGSVSYDWSGVYFRIRFKGPYLAMKCSDTGTSWLNQWTDKEMSPEADKKILVGAKDTLIVLAEGLGKGEHEVIIQKRTEGDQGCLTVHSFMTEGELVQASGRKSRHIEFIGDSYTCGYGTESSSRDDHFLAETENCNITYAAIASRYFNADFNLISHSGQGICRNYDNHMAGYNMADRYSQTLDMNKEYIWNPETAPYSPDIVVIYLCTNDFSTGCQPNLERFAGRYLELLKKVKDNYGEDIPVLCMGSNCSSNTYDYLRYVYTICGMKNVAYMAVSKDVHNSGSDLGAGWHPNYTGQLKVASCAIPYISTLTGWEMEPKAYL